MAVIPTPELIPQERVVVPGDDVHLGSAAGESLHGVADGARGHLASFAGTA